MKLFRSGHISTTSILGCEEEEEEDDSLTVACWPSCAAGFGPASLLSVAFRVVGRRNVE